MQWNPFKSCVETNMRYLNCCSTMFTTATAIREEAVRIVALKANMRPKIHAHHFSHAAWEHREGKSAKTLTFAWQIIANGKSHARNQHLPPPNNNAAHHGGQRGEVVHWEKMPEPERATAKRKRKDVDG